MMLPATRREVLAATGALLAAGVAPRALGAVRPALFLIDSRLPEGPALAAQARAAGHPSRDPQGEVIRLLLGEPGLMQAGTILGLTSWTDFVLARDALARPVRSAHALPLARDEAVEHPLLAALLAACPGRENPRATSFLWLV